MHKQELIRGIRPSIYKLEGLLAFQQYPKVLHQQFQASMPEIFRFDQSPKSVRRNIHDQGGLYLTTFDATGDLRNLPKSHHCPRQRYP